MSEFVHFAEYSVVKKYEGAYGRKRNLTIASYIICPILILFAMLALLGAGAFIWFIPLCPFFLAIIIPLTYNRYYKIEYDYRIAGGDFNIAEVYNKKSRKEILDIKIASLERIAPYRGQYKDSADRISYARRYEAVSSMKAEDLYFAILPHPEDNSQKTIIFFEPTSKMLTLLNFYNRQTVVVPVKY